MVRACEEKTAAGMTSVLAKERCGVHVSTRLEIPPPTARFDAELEHPTIIRRLRAELFEMWAALRNSIDDASSMVWKRRCLPKCLFLEAKGSSRSVFAKELASGAGSIFTLLEQSWCQLELPDSCAYRCVILMVLLAISFALPALNSCRM